MLSSEMGRTEVLALKTSEKNVRHGASRCFYAIWAKSWASLLIKKQAR